MMNHIVHTLKDLLKEIWEDFRNPVSPARGDSNCCSSTFFNAKDNLRPELIKVIRNDIKAVNLNKSQS